MRPGGLVAFDDGVLGLGQHRDGAFSGRAVDQEVTEEDLRGGCAERTVLGLVLRLDIDGGVGGFLLHVDLRGLCMGAGHTVGLAFGSLDDEEDAAVVSGSLVKLEGESLVGAHDSCRGGRFYAREGRRGHHYLAATGDDPVIEAGEQVRPGDLGLGSEDGTAFLREG